MFMINYHHWKMTNTLSASQIIRKTNYQAIMRLSIIMRKKLAISKQNLNNSSKRKRKSWPWWFQPSDHLLKLTMQLSKKAQRIISMLMMWPKRQFMTVIRKQTRIGNPSSMCQVKLWTNFMKFRPKSTIKSCKLLKIKWWKICKKLMNNFVKSRRILRKIPSLNQSRYYPLWTKLLLSYFQQILNRIIL